MSSVAIHLEAACRFPRLAPKTTITIRRASRRAIFLTYRSAGQSFQRREVQVDLHLTAVNVTNKYALYNFLSTFSGTHYVTPRALTAELGFHF